MPSCLNLLGPDLHRVGRVHHEYVAYVLQFEVMDPRTPVPHPVDPSDRHCLSRPGGCQRDRPRYRPGGVRRAGVPVLADDGRRLRLRFGLYWDREAGLGNAVDTLWTK